MNRQFPKSWPIRSFKDVAEIVTGTTPSTSHPEYYGRSFPFVGPGDLGKTEPITLSSKWLSDVGAQQARLLPPESVLVCCIGATIGKIGFSGIKLATNQQINALVFDKKLVFPRYAFYYVKTLESLIRHNGASTTLPILPKGRFQKLQIPLPPIDEQRRIAAILDKADAVRRKRKEAIALTEDLLRSAFLEMFGDPVTNPKGWESDLEEGTLLSLDNVADVIDCKHRTPIYTTEGYPVIRPRDVREDGIKFSKCIKTSHEEYVDLIEGREPNKGDIIYSRNATFGVASLLETDRKFTIGQDVCLIKPKSVEPAFLFYLLNSHFVRNQLGLAISGSTFKRINLKSIRKLKVFVPAEPQQVDFSTFYSANRRQKARCKQAVEESENLFNSLLQRAFRGDL